MIVVGGAAAVADWPVGWSYARRFAGAAVFAIIAVARPDRRQRPARRAADRVPAHHHRAAARLRDPEHLDHPAARLAAAAPTDESARARRTFLELDPGRRRGRRGRCRRRDSCWPARPRAVSRPGSDCELPRAAKPAAPPYRPGPTSDVADLTPYVTPNDDFYRIDTALQVPVIDPENWTLQDHRDGRQPAPDRLRHTRGQAAGRAHGHPDLRLQRGRRRPGRQRPLAGLPDPRAARRGRPAGRRRHGAVDQRRRLDRRHARWTC